MERILLAFMEIESNPRVHLGTAVGVYESTIRARPSARPAPPASERLRCDPNQFAGITFLHGPLSSVSVVVFLSLGLLAGQALLLLGLASIFYRVASSLCVHMRRVFYFER